MSARAIEEVDLVVLAQRLRAQFGPTMEQDYLDGRTVLRDAVIEYLECPVLIAEDLIDTMEAAGYLRFPRLSDDTHSQRVMRWRIG